MSSHVQLEKASKRYGVKPIFGLEAYMHPEPKSNRKFHLTLLATDQRGYANLNKIVTRSFAENFYYWPTVNGEMLRDHHEGLIVISGCSDSLLACSLLGGKTIEPGDASYERARKQAAAFKRLVGDRFYLECQAFPELPRSGEINRAYEKLGADLQIPLVGTQDVHYPLPDDNEMQVILHAAGRGNNTIGKQVESWEYNIRLTHPISDRAIFDRLVGTGLSRVAAQGACRATGEIADRCNVILPKAADLKFPVEQVRPGLTSEELIWEWMRDGWTYRVRQGNKKLLREKAAYLARLNHEMKDIKTKDFIDYFLITADAVRFAKDAGIPVGPARGSAAASLVCYLLRITEIDPMEYPLMYFERFIDPTRTDIPDIDLDFASNRRHEVREFLERRYGSDRVGNIANYVRYKGRNSIDDIARVYRIPKVDAETVKGMLIERSGGDSRADFTLADTVNMFPAVQAVFDRHPDLWKAARLEGNYKGMNVHAAGLVVTTDRPISDVCATYAREVKGHPVSVVAVDKYDAEYVNFLKLDFLGLNTMEMLDTALKLADLELEDLYRVSMEDEQVMEAFRRNDVVGIFQFEGRATRLVNRDVKPDAFMELAAINALSRPGPLFSGTTADYIDVKWGRKSPRRWHPIIDELTESTNYQIIYQEQILKILELIGGLPVAEVHEIRKIISKKLGEAKFNESAESFAAGAKRLHGIDAETAKGIWGRLVTSATYAFNVAHCISYSMLAVWAMWFKVRYPAAFYTAQLLMNQEKPSEWPRLIKDAAKHGITVHGVRPGLSGMNWTMVNETEIAAGWKQLEGVGDSKAEKIVDFLENDPIQNLPNSPPFKTDDLLHVSGIGPKVLEKFRDQIEGDDPFGLKRVERALSSVREDIKRGNMPLSPPTCRSDDILDLPGDSELIWIGIARVKEYKDYVEDERARSGKDIEEIKREMWLPDLPTSCVLHCGDDGDEDVYVRVKRQDYPRFKDGLERIRLGRDVIWVRARKSSNSFGASLYVKQLIIIDPDAG